MRVVLIFLSKGALPFPMQLTSDLHGSGGSVYLLTNVLLGISNAHLYTSVDERTI